MNEPSLSTSVVLRVEGLWKEYVTPAEPLVVLRGIDLEIGAGESLAVIGPSGSGKSTLLHILGTLDRPTRGTVRLGEVDPFELPADKLAAFRNQRIGFIFQDHHLLPQCSALENVVLPALAGGRAGREEMARAADLLARVGLTGRQSHLPAELSGGERQRVAVARALMNRPGLLLCDEPTGNLDPKIAASVGDLLRNLAAESRAILIVVTHSMGLAETFGARMRMDEGRLVGL
jgi:lipoprotein-releasing system ATP-binding protein